MKTRRLWRAALTAIVLAGLTWLVFFSGMRNSPSATPTEGSNAFQQAFWEERPLDLALQACLIIAGALGVAAILPAKDEE